MYAVQRRSYSPSLIDNPASRLWPIAFYVQLDTLPAERISKKGLSAQSSNPWCLDPVKAAQPTASAPTTDPSAILPLHSRREHIKVRFRMLRRLPSNHDNEGAEAANRRSVDVAIAFIDGLKEPFPPCYATLDNDGSAVIEFEGSPKGFFADLTFYDNGNIECYQRQSGRPSKFFEGALDSVEARDFINNNIGAAY